jgi:hypothetical protein
MVIANRQSTQFKTLPQTLVLVSILSNIDSPLWEDSYPIGLLEVSFHSIASKRTDNRTPILALKP